MTGEARLNAGRLAPARLKSSRYWCAAPLVVSLAIFTGRTRLLPLNGDEPHYLIIAESVAMDRDLDVRNNYLRDFDDYHIYGLTIPHVYNVPRGWMPAHMPGLGILVAAPFAIAGARGARILLILIAGTLPFITLSVLRRSGETVDDLAVWTACGLTVAVPTLFGAPQIYPDLPAGVLTLALTVWLLRRGVSPSDPSTLNEDQIAERGGREYREYLREEQRRQPGWSAREVVLDQRGRATRSALGWAAFWLWAGLLPWLHVKYAGTTLVLVAGGLLIGWRSRSRQLSAAAIWLSPLVAFGIVALIGFHMWAFGTPLGPPRASHELTTSPARAAEIFLGLHLDQSQGMFVQHPLLLLGVAGLPWLLRSRPAFGILWLALYASAILPNSLELARYGGNGPVGRFAWTAMWLWTIPAAILVVDFRDRFARYIRPAVLLVFAYQAALAVRWLATPGIMFPHLDPPRDSMFPERMQPWLPSFYFWDFSGYWRFGANVIALGIVLLVFCAGMVARTPERDT